jgi:hypothetical protein
VFETLKPSYVRSGGRLTDSQPTVVTPRRRGFLDCLFGPPEYVQPGSGDPSGPQPRSVTVDVRCPEISEEGAELQLGAEVLIALPSGATNIKVWSSGTRAVTPNASIAAFLVGIAPLGIVQVPEQVAFRPLWVRLGKDGASSGSLEATLLVTFEI